ncbi:hypothetical protein AYI68_g7615 [Smittium mucronatum]|uniref:Uncharacterized protein n=1 Tax=Smittium mucronatum TaxID=133383 RepID=A0A1R0GN85_9FUNG|nr:hypothetical protein AYI68_g7615 [Smittium mucronatum]
MSIEDSMIGSRDNESYQKDQIRGVSSGQFNVEKNDVFIVTDESEIDVTENQNSRRGLDYNQFSERKYKTNGPYKNELSTISKKKEVLQKSLKNTRERGNKSSQNESNILYVGEVENNYKICNEYTSLRNKCNKFFENKDYKNDSIIESHKTGNVGLTIKKKGDVNNDQRYPNRKSHDQIFFSDKEIKYSSFPRPPRVSNPFKNKDNHMTPDISEVFNDCEIESSKYENNNFKFKPSFKKKGAIEFIREIGHLSYIHPQINWENISAKGPSNWEKLSGKFTKNKCEPKNIHEHHFSGIDNPSNKNIYVYPNIPKEEQLLHQKNKDSFFSSVSDSLHVSKDVNKSIINIPRSLDSYISDEDSSLEELCDSSQFYGSEISDSSSNKFGNTLLESMKPKESSYQMYAKIDEIKTGKGLEVDKNAEKSNDITMNNYSQKIPLSKKKSPANVPKHNKSQVFNDFKQNKIIQKIEAQKSESDMHIESIVQTAYINICMLNLDAQIYSAENIQKKKLNIEKCGLNGPVKDIIYPLLESFNKENKALKISMTKIFEKYKLYEFLQDKSLQENCRDIGPIRGFERYDNDVDGFNLRYLKYEAERNLIYHLNYFGEYCPELTPFATFSTPQKDDLNLISVRTLDAFNFAHFYCLKKDNPSYKVYQKIIQEELDCVKELFHRCFNNFFFFESPKSEILSKKRDQLPGVKMLDISEGNLIHIVTWCSKDDENQQIALLIMERNDFTINNIISYSGTCSKFLPHHFAESGTALHKYMANIISMYLEKKVPITIEILLKYYPLLDEFVSNGNKHNDCVFFMRISESIRLNEKNNLDLNFKIISDQSGSFIDKLNKIHHSSHKELDFFIQPSYENGTMAVSALSAVSKIKTSKKVDGNDHLAFLTPTDQFSCTAQLVFSKNNSGNLGINFVKGLVFNSNPIYNDMLQYTKFFVFLSLSVIQKTHLDMFHYMTEDVYNVLVEESKRDFKAASKYYPLPTAYIKLTDSENYYSSQIYNTPIPARYVYIVATDNILVKTSAVPSNNPQRMIVLKYDKEICRLPEMHFFGDNFSGI